MTDEDDDEESGKTFSCTRCGELFTEDEWNDGDICDGCMGDG
jgi:formylmethanofuran dehydrogenase subunit E